MQANPVDIEPVSATLEYLQNAQRRPVTYVPAPPDGQAREGADHVEMPVTIHDARGRVEPPTLDGEGYRLADAPSAMRAFTDAGAIQQVYYPEMEELARAASGARRAIVFDHLVRRRAPDSSSPFGARAGRRPGTATRVHCDFTPSSAQRRLALETQARGIGKVGHYAILNLWRSTGLPVLDAPLALCDARTVRPSELVAADIVYPTRTGEIFELLYSPDHAWSYFHAMAFDEVLLFKQFDSREGVACYTPHAAFAHPATPADTPPRESIEARCLLIYD